MFTALVIQQERSRLVVGLDGFEPSTPALSRRCSNQLSYRPFGTQRTIPVNGTPKGANSLSSEQQPISVDA